MDSLAGEVAARDLCQTQPGTLACVPEHLRFDIDAVKAAARPTRPHCDSYSTPYKTTARPRSTLLWPWSEKVSPDRKRESSQGRHCDEGG